MDKIKTVPKALQIGEQRGDSCLPKRRLQQRFASQNHGSEDNQQERLE